MAAKQKAPLSRMFDLPLLMAACLTIAFYAFVHQPAMHDTLLHRYTTHHVVEYIIVGFFIWGLCDVFFKVLSFPRQSLALRHDWLPPRKGREPVSHAVGLYGILEKKPAWLLQSRVGQRLLEALGYVKDRGSTDGLADHLRYLAELDDERAHNNYGLVRFICWVTPVLGFFGTVLHFGSALGGLSVDEIGERLPTVVGEMGTAFNTTTVALAAATSMMFSLFLCEKTERELVRGTDRLAERELLNRFETSDASLAPFLNAIETASQSMLRTMDETVERQLGIWSSAFHDLQRQADERHTFLTDLWQQTMESLHQRFEASDNERERKLVKVLEAMELQREQHRADVLTTVEHVTRLQTDLTELAAAIADVVHGKGELVKLQASLADNVRLLRETGQIDQALHGLTAAIHLITARYQPSALGLDRAA
ncbi:MAG TPA: MotA/TolQ/ExbB proton channel family protein [Pirellulales bacterium]|nr:MotA/TolQ/ExbB proton channel family protein [Pirellulales bacterium]